MNKFLPTNITKFNTYKENDLLIGVNGEIELPSLEATTTTISGAGIMGEFENPNIGNFGSLGITIAFRSICDESFELFEPKMHTITLRANAMSQDTATGIPKNYPVKVTVRGIPKAFNTGKLKAGEGTDTQVPLELSYIKIEVDNKVKLELDKFNYVYIVNRKDYLEEERRNI